MQSLTPRQAALIVVIAEILKERLDSNEPVAKKLAAALDDAVFEFAALGIAAPTCPFPKNSWERVPVAVAKP